MASNYAKDWKEAKTKFTTETKLDKPTEKDSFLFISWRKPSGIEDALEGIDKLIDKTLPKDMKDAFYKKYDELNVLLKQKAGAYLQTLEESIKKEKDEAGKTTKYRHMKILRASLEAIIARVNQYYNDKLQYYKIAKVKGSDTLTKTEAVLKTLNMLGTNLKSGVAKGTLFYQEVLSNPTPLNWNRINTDAGGRSASQSISNIVKFVYADHVELLVKGGKVALETLEILDDDRVAEKVRQLNIFLYSHSNEIMALGKETGGSAMDGSLGFLANNPSSNLPTTATKEEVTAAAKRFGGMMKTCAEIATQLLRFGT